jgi:protein involved in polysaccharide export with SLBB domain
MNPRLLLPVVCTWAVVVAPGCASVWWNSLLDPSQVGNFHENIVSEIQQTITFRDSPGGIPGATDPTPEDLIQTVEEYRIGVNDQLVIRILDLLERGVESEFRPTVDELGYIILPQLGWMHVEGMTARELRAELIQRLKDTGLFRPESGEPTVVIEFLIQQQRVYHIGGTIQAPGRYRIIPPDFRLREAVNQAGGLDPSVKTIYVLRNSPKPKRIIDRGVRPGPATGDMPEEPLPAPPVSPAGLSEMAGGPASPVVPIAVPSAAVAAAVAQAPAASTAPVVPAQPGPIALPTEQELLEAVAPTQPAPTGAAPSTPAGESGSQQPAPAPRTSPFIFVNEGFVPMEPAGAPAQAPEAGQHRPGRHL